MSKEYKSALTESVRNLALGLKLNTLFTLLAYNRHLKDSESVERTPTLFEYLRRVVDDIGTGADIRIVALKETEVPLLPCFSFPFSLIFLDLG